MTNDEFAVIQRNMAAARGEVQTLALIETPKRRGRMNKLEAAFQREVLQPRQDRGEIIWFDFECAKFRLADGAWYCPDFCAIETTGAKLILEIKGFWREAARVRIKVAADKYPFAFVAVTKDRKTGEWVYERIRGRATA